MFKQIMSKYPWLIVVAVSAAIVGGALLWYLASPLFVNQSVAESLPPSKSGQNAAPASDFKTLSSGALHDADSFHKGSGDAKIIQSADGKRLLRLENFKVTNGPDLYIWLSKAADAKSDTDVTSAGYVELGRLKGNLGDQNYELPSDLNLSQYHAVVIWCKNFSVLFAAAPLK